MLHPDFRKTKVASAMADVIVEAAKLRGCTRIIGAHYGPFYEEFH